jgi:Tfp pilus assembly PilM family ATPase
LSWRIARSRTPIGLDVGERHVKAAQFSRAGSAWRLESAAAIPRSAGQAPLEGEELRRLRQALAANGFHGSAVVLAVPNDKLLTGIMELPPLESGAPLEVLARGELARMHKCDPKAIEMACWQLPQPIRAANTAFVMGAACAHADADALLDAFEGEGFSVERLEVQAAAVARACRPLLADVRGIAGILDVGWASARLVLLYRDVVVYERKLTRGGLQPLLQALADERGLDVGAMERLLEDGELSDPPAATPDTGSVQAGPGGASCGVGILPASVRPPDAGKTCLPAASRQVPAPQAAMAAAGTDGPIKRLAEGIVAEMRIPLSYLANQYPDAPVQRLLIVGGGGRLGWLRDHLAAALDTDVRIALPSDLAECPDSFDRQFGPTLAVALGLGGQEEG